MEFVGIPEELNLIKQELIVGVIKGLYQRLVFNPSIV